MSNIQVSIIIVNFNSVKMLDDCINSIKAFTRDVAYEIVVVDNDSSEPTDWIQKKHTDVKFIFNKTNKGFAAANNQGVSIAKGEYILYLNNDTLFTENTLGILLDYLKQLSFDPIIGCRLLNADGSFQESANDFDSVSNSISENLFIYKVFPKSHFWNKAHLNYEEVNSAVETGYVKGAFLLCKKSLVDKLNGFDELFYFYSEEADFCFRAQKMGVKVIFYPNTSIIHLGGATTDNMPWFGFKHIHISKMKYLIKNARGVEKFLMIFFHYLGILVRGVLYTLFGLVTFQKKQIMRGWFYIRKLFICAKYK